MEVLSVNGRQGVLGGFRCGSIQNGLEQSITNVVDSYLWNFGLNHGDCDGLYLGNSDHYLWDTAMSLELKTFVVVAG